MGTYTYYLLTFKSSEIYMYLSQQVYNCVKMLNAFKCDTRTNKSPLSVWECMIHTVYLLHVSVIHMAIFREVHYRGHVHRNITAVYDQWQI